MPFAFAALICGCNAAGSLPARSTIALAPCAIAAFMPCTHCEGWPWLSQTVTLTPAREPIRFMLSEIVDTNGTLLEAGITNSVLPPAFAFASKAGPGATNVGTFLYLSRFACTPAGTAADAATVQAA